MHQHKLMCQFACITHAAHRLDISCLLIHALVHQLTRLILNVAFHLLADHLFFSLADNFFRHSVEKCIHLFYMAVISLIGTIFLHVTHMLTFPFLNHRATKMSIGSSCFSYAFCSCNTFPTAPAYSFHSSFWRSNSFLPFLVIL